MAQLILGVRWVQLLYLSSTCLLPISCLDSVPPEYLLYQNFGAAAAGGNQHLMDEVVAPLGKYRGFPCEEEPLTGAEGRAMAQTGIGVCFPGGSHRGLVNAAEA